MTSQQYRVDAPSLRSMQQSQLLSSRTYTEEPCRVSEG